MTDYIFKTPTYDESPLAKEYPFSRFKFTRAYSIVKLAGVYYQITNLDADLISTYQECYQGGGTHTVTSAVRTALLAGGVGVTSGNFTAI